MALIEINRNPTRRQLGWFAGLWLVVLGMLGAAAWSRPAPGAAAALWFLAVAVPALGLLRPAVLRTIYLALAHATYPIGFAVSHVILAAVYFLVLTPIGLLVRLLGHDPLGLRRGWSAGSFWQRRAPVTDRTRYFRQY
jgi:hypothetical protein